MDWNGDVDLNDGKIAKLHAEYMSRLRFLQSICMNEQRRQCAMIPDLIQLQEDLEADMTFLSLGKPIGKQQLFPLLTWEEDRPFAHTKYIIHLILCTCSSSENVSGILCQA